MLSTPDVQQLIHERVPLRICLHRERPDDAYAAIRYRDHCFYVDGADHTRVCTFATMLVLFELLAPGRLGP